MYFAVLAVAANLLSISSALPNPVSLDQRTTCSPLGISAARAQQVVKACTDIKLIPSAVPSFTPKVEVSVAYGSKKANLGTVYSTLETVSEPTITFSGEADQDPATTKYVILMVDPDAPGPTSSGSPAVLSYFLHRALYDASPSCINSANYGGGKSLAMYKPLTPLSVPSHRYTQLVYRQPAGYTPRLELAYLAGGLFDLNAFVSQGRLTLVGGNFFLQGLGTLGAVGN